MSFLFSMIIVFLGISGPTHGAVPPSTFVSPTGSLDAVAPFHVAISYPLGGEVFAAGTVIDIEWNEIQSHNGTNWDVFYSTDGGTVFRALAYNLPAEARKFSWAIPNITTSQAQVRVIQDNDTVDYVATSANFSIQMVSTSTESEDELPRTLVLYPNFPNPFSSSTEIRIFSPTNARVLLEVFDASGARVATLADRRFASGHYRFQWNADRMPSGTYFSKLTVNDHVSTKSMVVIR